MKFVAWLFPFFGAGQVDVAVWSHAGPYAITIAGLLLSGVFVVDVIRRRREATRAEIIYCSVLVATVATVFITALSRSYFPIQQALSGRYSPVPLLFWISLAALITLRLSRWESSGGCGRAVWCGVLIVLSICTLSTQVPLGIYMAERERLQQAAADSIAIGVPDEQNISVEFSLPVRVRMVDGQATRTLGHSLFARPETAMLGQPLSSRFQIEAAGECAGAFDQATVLPDGKNPGARLLGWAWDQRDGRVAERVWVTDDHLVIQGFGVTHAVPPPVIEFRGAGLGVPGCALDIVEGGAVLQRRGNEGSPHGMRRVSTGESDIRLGLALGFAPAATLRPFAKGSGIHG